MYLFAGELEAMGVKAIAPGGEFETDRLDVHRARYVIRSGIGDRGRVEVQKLGWALAIDGVDARDRRRVGALPSREACAAPSSRRCAEGVCSRAQGEPSMPIRLTFAEVRSMSLPLWVGVEFETDRLDKAPARYRISKIDAERGGVEVERVEALRIDARALSRQGPGLAKAKPRTGTWAFALELASKLAVK